MPECRVGTGANLSCGYRDLTPRHRATFSATRRHGRAPNGIVGSWTERRYDVRRMAGWSHVVTVPGAGAARHEEVARAEGLNPHRARTNGPIDPGACTLPACSAEGKGTTQRAKTRALRSRVRPAPRRPNSAERRSGSSEVRGPGQGQDVGVWHPRARTKVLEAGQDGLLVARE